MSRDNYSKGESSKSRETRPRSHHASSSKSREIRNDEDLSMSRSVMRTTRDGLIKFKENDGSLGKRHEKQRPRRDSSRDKRRKVDVSPELSRRHEQRRREGRPRERPAVKVEPREEFKMSGLLVFKNPVGPAKKVEEKQKPNFGLSGKLAEDTNKFNGVVVKYNEPPEAKKPARKWRLYPFKGEESLDFIEIWKQSAYLLGRDRRCVDIPIDHPSCSSQHAVIQFRSIVFEREDGSSGRKVRPYLIDLDSSNGTLLNGTKIEGRKYYEIMDKDVIKFGFSTREYVLMNEEFQETKDDN